MQLLLFTISTTFFWSVKSLAALNNENIICKPLNGIDFIGNLICKQSDAQKWYFLNSDWSAFNGITDLTIINPSNISKPILNLNFYRKLHELEHLTISNLHLDSFNDIHIHKLNNLKTINLSNNEIISLPEKLFIKNINLCVIDLSHNKVKQIADNVFERNRLNEMLIELKNKFQENIKYLYTSDELNYPENSDYRRRKEPITEFPLRSMDLDINDYTSLLQLYLHDNELMYIKSVWFESLSNLEILTLHNNRIHDVNGNIFAHNRNLLQLRINDNELTNVQNISGTYFPNLKVFDISNNPEIESLDLKQLNTEMLFLTNVNVTECTVGRSVRILQATSNKINRIIVHGTGHSLEELYLAHNQFTNLPNLMEFENLIILDLAHNYIEAIHENDLKGLTNLRHLKLDHNKISSIHYQSFTNQMNLIHLNLSQNALKVLYSNFSAARKLEVLDISGNKLTSLDPKIKRQAINLREILLSDNQWDCDYIMNLSSFLASENIETAGNDNAKGIKCHRKEMVEMSNPIFEGKNIHSNPATDAIITGLKRDIEQMVDFKIGQLERKLTDLIHTILNK